MDKIRSSVCFSCCFRGSDVDLLAHHTSNNLGSSSNVASLIRSSSAWIRSKAQDLPEVRDRYRRFLSRIGSSYHRGDRQPSADFRYDPLSYALNFDEGPDFDDGEEISPVEFKYRSFSSRLPASPPLPSPQPPRPPSTLSADGVACS